MEYVKRAIEIATLEYVHAFPAIGLTGPRQSGKSTLIKHLFKNYTYVTFDDYKMRTFIESDPEAFIKKYQNKVIFDEVQKAPAIFDLVKIAIDEDRQHYGKFVLTSSSQFLFLKYISESLAGRIGLLNLLPFQYAEIPSRMRKQSIYKGAYPELVMRDYAHDGKWHASYLDTYLNKDVREIKDIGNLRDFRRFIELLAANTSSQLNMAHYANALGISVPTIKSWVSVLEASYIIFLLPPYYKNYGKRIIKAPKIYFYDTGLVSYLTAIETERQFEKGPMLGAIFENYIISEIVKKEKHADSQAQLFYFRTSGGIEVDLVIERKKQRELIEIKSSSSFTQRMLSPMKSIQEEGDKIYILYRGDAFPYSKDIHVINYKHYLVTDAQ